MTTLFIITSLSQNMIDIINVEKSKGEIIIITPNKDFYDSYQELFPEIIFVGIDANHDGSNDNAEFARQFMPGVIGDLRIPKSKLEVWKALSIDRLRFWYRGNAYKYKELLESIDWKLCYTSLDMGSVMPMHAMWIARNRTFMKNDTRIVAVKTEPIRTPEILDLAPLFTFDGYVVDTAEEAQFLRDIGTREDAVIMVTGRGIPARRDGQLRDVFRKSMDVESDDLVLGILLDKRDEWQVASFLNEISSSKAYKSFVIVPVDSRTKELMYDIVPESMAKYISPHAMLDACDEIVTFRWDDHYCYNLPAKLNIIDYRNVNRANELAPYKLVIEA